LTLDPIGKQFAIPLAVGAIDTFPAACTQVLFDGLPSKVCYSCNGLSDFAYRHRNSIADRLAIC
jgi:hypothetical protein